MNPLVTSAKNVRMRRMCRAVRAFSRLDQEMLAGLRAATELIQLHIWLQSWGSWVQLCEDRGSPSPRLISIIPDMTSSRTTDSAVYWCHVATVLSQMSLIDWAHADQAGRLRIHYCAFSVSLFGSDSSVILVCEVARVTLAQYAIYVRSGGFQFKRTYLYMQTSFNEYVTMNFGLHINMCKTIVSNI